MVKAKRIGFLTNSGYSSLAIMGRLAIQGELNLAYITKVIDNDFDKIENTIGYSTAIDRVAKNRFDSLVVSSDRAW